MIENLIILIACHFIGDFPFQSEWFVSFKGKSWEVCVYHAAVYTATFVIFTDITMIFALILFVSHVIIDPLKARWHVLPYIWQDQLLHFVVINTCLFGGIALK